MTTNEIPEEVRIRFGMIRVSNEEFRTVEWLRPKDGLRKLRERLDSGDSNRSQWGDESGDMSGLIDGVTLAVGS